MTYTGTNLNKPLEHHPSNSTLPFTSLNFASSRKLGLIIPSSNTVAEPLTNAILSAIPNLSVHYTRVSVTTLGTDSASTTQFSASAMIAAAQLLADAHVDAILWNGTSGMWIGTDLDAEVRLGEEMSQATGIPCSTTTIATVEALKYLGVRTISLAAPYSAAMMDKLGSFFEACGYEIAGTSRLEQVPPSNLEIAKTSDGDIRAAVRNAYHEATEAVVVACTNWPAAPLVDDLEKEEHGKFILDSVVVTAWWGLKALSMKTTVEGWGKLMSGAV